MDDGRFSDGSNYLNIMQNQEKADDNDLPSTGVSYQWEKLLSSIFITSESYGTRSTTLIRVNQSGDFQVHEQTHLPNLPISNVEFSGRLTIESSHLP